MLHAHDGAASILYGECASGSFLFYSPQKLVNSKIKDVVISNVTINDSHHCRAEINKHVSLL